jgi:hypothetical protein
MADVPDSEAKTPRYWLVAIQILLAFVLLAAVAAPRIVARLSDVEAKNAALSPVRSTTERDTSTDWIAWVLAGVLVLPLPILASHWWCRRESTEEP